MNGPFCDLKFWKVTYRTGFVETVNERSGPDVAAAAAMMRNLKNQFDV